VEVLLEICRNRPGGVHAGGEGRFDVFRIETAPSATVLDALTLIRETLDPTLLFRHSCHHGSCGTCACIINGAEALACLTPLSGLGNGPVRVEPLRRMRPIGDIAVDPGPLFSELDPAWTYLTSSNIDAGERDAPSAVRFESCIECGCCVSSCPVSGDFMGPAALALLNRERIKKPEFEAGLLERAAAPRGAGRCERAINCSRVCPAGVNPSGHIVELNRRIRKLT
jgi:succinate dehydrogenase / fumarate reductase iron-sulfur subunit